jgi:hypothetical protein
MNVANNASSRDLDNITRILEIAEKALRINTNGIIGVE